MIVRPGQDKNVEIIDEASFEAERQFQALRRAGFSDDEARELIGD